MAITETYALIPSAGQAGQICSLVPATVISRTVETSAGVAFGVVVSQGSADHGCVIVASGATKVLGIVVINQASKTSGAIEQYGTASILVSGEIWVTVTDSGGVVAGDDVWLKLSDATFRNDDVGSSGGLKLAGCKYLTSAANGALAKVRVDFNVPAVAGA